VREGTNVRSHNAFLLYVSLKYSFNCAFSSGEHDEISNSDLRKESKELICTGKLGSESLPRTIEITAVHYLS